MVSHRTPYPPHRPPPRLVDQRLEGHPERKSIIDPFSSETRKRRGCYLCGLSGARIVIEADLTVRAFTRRALILGGRVLMALVVLLGRGVAEVGREEVVRHDQDRLLRTNTAQVELHQCVPTLKVQLVLGGKN